MSFSVVGSVNHLISEYRRFLLSTYRLADKKLRDQFEDHIKEADVLVKGPYVTLANDFAREHTLKQLHEEGVGHKDLQRLNWSFGEDQLYLHQENAFRRMESLLRNFIIKTGTGSGKTEAFLLPILSGILKQRADGVKGTKAILLYPMNALANDQLVRLRKLIRDSGVGVTFAMYTGESESVALTLGEPVEGNEFVRRKEIQDNQPDILLTNYKQLEFLLVRKEDRTLFSPSLSFLVLDEIHSYRGALATEMACLIRRLKARAGVGESKLHCIGTSATVSKDAGGDQALAEFASSLFGESFSQEDVIGETLITKPPPKRTYLAPFSRIAPEEIQAFDHENDAKLTALAEKITGQKLMASGSMPQRIRMALEGNKLVALLETECREPHSLVELAGVLKTSFQDGDAQALTEQEWRSLIEAYLLVGSVGTEKDPPNLRPKLHTFFQGVYDVGLCMNPACRLLVRDGSETCPKCQSAVRPAALCRTCGQDFVKVRFDEQDPTKTYPNDDFTSNDDTGFITPRVHLEQIDDDEDEDGEKNETNAKSRKRQAHTKSRLKLLLAFVCHETGRVYQEMPDGSAAASVTQQWVMRGRGNTCPVCNSTYTKGDILTLLRSGAASSNSVLATHHLDRLPLKERKLLIFADNRQEAAHQAGYMGDRHRQFAVRHAIEQVVRDAGPSGLSLNVISHKLLEKFQDMGLAWRKLSSDELKFWRKALEFEAAGEFCRATHQRISLENLGLVEVQYEFLDQLTSDNRFKESCEHAGLKVSEGAVLVRAILDHMRRHRAVAFDFYQRYLDATREPWSILANEPYSIGVGEHERTAQYFMMDRPEAARSSAISGCKFSPLVKDSDKGGLGGIMRLVVKKARVPDKQADGWVRALVDLLREYEILEPAGILPPNVRRSIGSGVPLQLSSRVIRLVPATFGFRCAKCQIWHPYRGLACYSSSRCSGSAEDLKPATVNNEGYYERLYTADVPRRLIAREHTAQIDQDERAKRENAFKEGKIDTLVCSPTLELGVNIGDLLTVLLRNCPPTPANYVQRAGRAGRSLRIGFISTFCGAGQHDRHCFDDPAWLVRGEFRPPTVKLDNGRILERHVRSFVLEELSHEFPRQMAEFVDDLDRPSELTTDNIAGLLEEGKTKATELVAASLKTFGKYGEVDQQFFSKVVGEMPQDIQRTLTNWFERIKRIFDEFEFYRRITADRQAKQKAASRERAYRELTTDKQAAYTLNYLSNEGLLPSYQFPIDTFSLEPGVNDTPTLRRSAWVALFEFAPGNLVYANGHKLKSIRAYFEGRNRAAAVGTESANLEGSGRVRPFCFCGKCGFVSEEVVNTCPHCGEPNPMKRDVAFIEAFEAEQNTQITSAEEARQRVYYERKENIVRDSKNKAVIHPYPFSHLEYRKQSRLLVSNWGKKTGTDGVGEMFDLCPGCGKHRPAHMTKRESERWDEDHVKRCNGNPRAYVLGYDFSADALVLPVPKWLIANEETEAFCRTLGTALVAGAAEMLELEPDEIAFFYHPEPGAGATVTFYETVPGGAGYLTTLASRLPEWAKVSVDRLFGHDCSGACYGCLKSYRNQPFHHLLDKNLVRDALFQFSTHERLAAPFEATANAGIGLSNKWIEENVPSSEAPCTENTPIERKLFEAIKKGGRLPEPVKQHEFRSGEVLITVADFAYELEKIAIYCDGFAFHGTPEKLAGDAQKRNYLQSQGWMVLTFWGKTILLNPERCEEQIWRAFIYRQQNDEGT
jgi:superfamily II DNA/RNA helicase/very-short-patch-repair endonuclease